MELRHLRYFAAVAENLSFRRAADRLHLTRPALSKQIRELEEELGVRLLDRTTARVRLTPAGAVYLDEVRTILAHAARATELAREAANGKRGRLVVGEPGLLGLTFLAPVLAAFRERFPHVDVALHELPSNEHVAAVQSGEIEVGFTVDARAAAHPSLARLAVRHLRVGAAVGRNHPLARRRRLHLREIAAQPLTCIGDPRASEHARYIREQFAAIGVAKPAIRTVSGIRSLMTMIASGHGLSLLPQAMAGEMPGDVIIVPLAGPPGNFEFDLFAVWRSNDDSLLLKNFVRTLRSHARPAAAA